MKKVISIILAIALCTACFAVDIEDVIAIAYEKSPKVAQYERSRQDSIMNSNLADRVLMYNVNVKQAIPIDGSTYHLPGADATISFDDRVSNISIKGQLEYSPDKNSDDSYEHRLTGVVSISKTFDFSGWTSSDYSRKIRDVNLEQAYAANVLNFRRSVLADVYSIIDAQQTISESERKLAELQKDYNAKLATGELKEGTTTQIKAKMTLDTTISSLDTSKKNLESKLAAFEKDYGFAYTEVDSASKPVLQFTRNADGNSKVYVAKLELLSAKQKLNEKTGRSNKIELSTKVQPFSISMGPVDNTSLFSVSPEVTYVNGNFSVTANMSTTYNKSEWSKPTMTIIGSYSGGNSNSVEIINLENDVYSKQLAYDTALFNYETSAKTVEDNIQRALVAYDQLEIRKDYNKRILDYTATLYENGFTTEKALEDARFDVESDNVDELLLNLTALQLECEIKILAL